MIIEKIEIQDGKYAITFKVSDTKYETIEVTNDALDKMLNLFQQAKLAHSGQVLEAEAKIKLDMETLNEKMSELRDEFGKQFQKQSTDLTNDVNYMRTIINKIESERSSILTQINVEIKKQLENLEVILKKVHNTETEAFKSVRTREQETQRIIEELKNKSEITWESINDIKEEIIKDKLEFDEIKKTVSEVIEDSSKLLSENKQGFTKEIELFKKNVESFIAENTKTLKEITEKSQKTIGSIYAKVEEAKKSDLKEKYLQNELKRKEELNAMKAEYIKKNVEKKINEIEMLKKFYETDSKEIISQIQKSFENAIKTIKARPEVFEEELKKINAYISEFKDKNLEVKKRKIEAAKNMAVKTIKKIEADSILGSIKKKIKELFK